MVQQLQNQDDNFAFETFLIVLIILFLYQRYRKADNRRRLAAVRNRAQPSISKNKVIIALELQGLFVDVSHHKRQNYSRIELKNTGVSHLVTRVKQLLGFGIYYQPLLPLSKMRTLLYSLKSNPKIHLFLYTRLSKEIATEILSKTTLSPFFPAECRRSSFEAYNQSLKHPTEVDFNTKRVIIVTSSHEDYLQDYSKYFWLVRKGELVESLKLLNSIVHTNKDIDELHNQLSDIKVALFGDEEGEEGEYQSLC